MGAGSPIATRIFGGFARNLTLQHLWFLWYLLVFVTLAPPVASILGLLLTKIGGQHLTKATAISLRWGWAPLALALVSVAGLILSGSSPGCPPNAMQSIVGSVPDVFLRYDSDWPYFLIYFLGGWVLYAFRDLLDRVGSIWLPTSAIGLAAYAASSALAGHGPGDFLRGPQQISAALLARHAVFAVAVAYTTFGFLGFFQRYLNRPTRVGRYLADTAFWIYLVHQDLLNTVVLGWV
jgi:hypothetical protein